MSGEGKACKCCANIALGCAEVKPKLSSKGNLWLGDSRDLVGETGWCVSQQGPCPVSWLYGY